MKPKNVNSIFLHGNDIEKFLFKSAMHWAEFGETVWFISPQPFNTLPNVWAKPPDKEILKMILFIYIPETKDLLNKLSEIHVVNKIPKVIIVMNLEHYCFPKNTEMTLNNAAFVSAALLDAVSTYAVKHSENAYLIAASVSPVNQKLQTILDLYFYDNIYDVTNNCDDLNFLTKVFSS